MEVWFGIFISVILVLVGISYLTDKETKPKPKAPDTYRIEVVAKDYGHTGICYVWYIFRGDKVYPSFELRGSSWKSPDEAERQAKVAVEHLLLGGAVYSDVNIEYRLLRVVDVLVAEDEDPAELDKAGWRQVR